MQKRRFFLKQKKGNKWAYGFTVDALHSSFPCRNSKVQRKLSHVTYVYRMTGTAGWFLARGLVPDRDFGVGDGIGGVAHALPRQRHRKTRTPHCIAMRRWVTRLKFTLRLPHIHNWDLSIPKLRHVVGVTPYFQLSSVLILGSVYLMAPSPAEGQWGGVLYRARNITYYLSSSSLMLLTSRWQ